MRKNLYGGVDLHSNNAMYVITDERDKQLLRQRLPNELSVVLAALAPYRPRLKVVAVESTYNWYWLVDGLQAQKYPVVLAHPSEMEQYYGITPCTLMSMMSNKLMPSACETDVTGVLSMYALSLASGEPSALLDWNNNYGQDRIKAVFFHCSNLPAAFFEQKPTMGYSEIFAGDVGQENAYGTLSGRIKSGAFTYCRLSTNDFDGSIQAYMGEAEFTNDPMSTFGGYGVAEVPRLQELMKFVCRSNFEHHVAANISKVADPLEEAFVRYLKWSVYRHN